ncbi:CRISPR-associated endonuclease Cas1 [filamentous cyanobacterium LEGE 11480]|uniref:CRISPR-associated endonuclease Cas1 n=1 Tax=Romeriopsis navalis LEGE 11480 TaxID=2777977 RepID=A0A928Z7B6_9CYAN|nr:CRISPR-associated endonuclease Cas1 [Romeriopsis navalis]MBE9033035.1 CRISPR-associated endonuclease Cas1 [Romeriopsis navalis LEGE 11480]
MQFHMHRLETAWQLVKRGSPSAGIDGITPELFAGVAQTQLQWLQRQLRQETYQASPARGFQLAKSSGGFRTIGIATVHDRIVQRYLLQGMYPKLERRYSQVCHAYRLGYSIYTAVAQVMANYRHQPAWVVKADIHKFFDSLVWALLMGQLEQSGLNPIVMQLVEQQLRAGMRLHGQWVPSHQGVIQGSILSGALANLYLSEFDRTCLDYGIDLVRYGDDCLAVCGSWMQANRALNVMTHLLEELYLTVHPEKTRIIAPDQAFTFLGHQFEAGEVTPPQRQSRASPKATKKTARATGGRPKVCSIVRSPRAAMPSSSSDTYWSEPMTTLYVTDQGAYVRVRDKQFQVFYQKELKINVPVNRVSHVVLFGCCNLSHGAVSLALQRRIPIMYLSSKGRYFGRLDTEGHAQVDYLTQQVQRSLDETFAIRQARSMIVAKLHNSRILLRRLQRKRPSEKAAAVIEALPEVIQQVQQADSIETMLGYEGHGANLYFQAYATLLRGKFEFEKRTRRPPTDPVNSLMSLGYTLLSQNLHSMVEVAGLHTHFGNLHAPQKNRPSLVCDLVEGFRAVVVDGFVAYLVNSNIFTEEDFTPPDARGGVYLQPDALKKFLKHWEEKLQQTITHPHTGYKVTYRRCFELQVWEYISVLMGERETYRPMKWEK